MDTTNAILVVEDEPITRRIYERILERAGFRVAVAENGVRALSLAADNPDLIVLDVNLPDLNGFEVCEQLKSRPETEPIPILFISATYGQVEDRVHGMSVGAEGFLAKPIEAVELIAYIRALLRAHRSEVRERAAQASLASSLEQLRASELRYRHLFEVSPHPMWVFDEETLRFLAVNEAAVALYGYSREEFLRMTIEHIRPQAEVAKLHHHLAAMRFRTEYRTRKLHRTKEGALVVADVAFHALEFEGRRARLTVAVDVTERERLEKQLRQAQKMEAIGRLAGGVAHDFNNLLTIISGYGELVIGRLPSDDPVREMVHTIKNASDRAAGLTRQLLAFSRQQVVAPRLLDLNVQLAELEKMLRRTIGEDIELLTVPGEGLWPIKADPSQIDQVILNLAVNARDAMPRGGKLTLETRNVEGSGDPEGAPSQPCVLLTVADTGHGMTEEVKAHIFEPFFTTKEIGKGTGLGLATVFGIVAQCNGHIEVESTVGAGTMFRICFPRAAAAEPVPSAGPRASPAPEGAETILVLEDDEAVRAITSLVLRQHGYTVLVADSGSEALRLAGQHVGPIQLLATDVVLPDMGGREVAQNLRARFPELKVLYLSGYTDDSIVRHGVQESEVHFLQKPFRLHELATKVREVLDA
jgi:PAS domain S-box-containing protein